jgi:glycosyltransferase involved in cell wall biosynthesis
MDAPRFKVIVTMEPESWILRRFGGYFHRYASEKLDCQSLELAEPLPETAEAIIYSNWPHLYSHPPGRRNLPGILMVGHMDRTAFRLRYLLWRYPRLQVVCMAQRWVDSMRRYLIPASRLHLLPHGIDLEMFQPTESVPLSRRVRIGFVGRAYPDGRKGEDRLLALSRLLSKEHYEFVLVGDRWEQVVEKLRAQGFTVDYQRRLPAEKLPAAIAGLDVLLVCARNEGGPQPVLEALACGVPVVSTKVGFVPDLKAQLPQHITLFLHDAEAVSALAQAKQYRQRAQIAVETTRQKLVPYTWQSWAQGMEELIWKSAGKNVASQPMQYSLTER